MIHDVHMLLGETMDDAMEEEGTAADEEMVVGQVCGVCIV